jgi:hypothetical protein
MGNLILETIPLKFNKPASEKQQKVDAINQDLRYKHCYVADFETCLDEKKHQKPYCFGLGKFSFQADFLASEQKAEDIQEYKNLITTCFEQDS